jgi:hypothetical protein
MRTGNRCIDCGMLFSKFVESTRCYLCRAAFKRKVLQDRLAGFEPKGSIPAPGNWAKLKELGYG